MEYFLNFKRFTGHDHQLFRDQTYNLAYLFLINYQILKHNKVVFKYGFFYNRIWLKNLAC